MSIVGYARVSSASQSLEVQLERLNKEGCERIYQEKQTARTADDRAELQECLNWVREGDVLVVTKLDRLARSTRDLLNIANTLTVKKVTLVVLDQQIDTRTPTGKLLFVVLGAIAEFENDIRKDRVSAGVALAKKKGVKFGRPHAISDVEVEDMKRRRDSGETIGELKKRYGISKATIYRKLGLKSNSEQSSAL